MSMSKVYPTALDDVIYPDSDGEPMAENFLQSIVIRMLVSGFERVFKGRDDMLVGGDFFWYPVAGQLATVVAADAMVIVDLPEPFDIFTNGSYRQWEHGGHPALVVEVLSPSNTWSEMTRKQRFYDQHGVDEYWVYEPRDGTFEVWVRQAGRLVAVESPADGWVSPTTGVHVRVEGIELIVHDSDGIRRWLTTAEEGALLDVETARANEATERAHVEAARANEATERAHAEIARANEATGRAHAEAARADALQARLDALEPAAARDL